jgi:hypothetical protein
MTTAMTTATADGPQILPRSLFSARLSGGVQTLSGRLAAAPVARRPRSRRGGARNGQDCDRLHAFQQHGHEFTIDQLACTRLPCVHAWVHGVRDHAAQCDRIGVLDAKFVNGRTPLAHRVTLAHKVQLARRPEKHVSEALVAHRGVMDRVEDVVGPSMFSTAHAGDLRPLPAGFRPSFAAARASATSQSRYFWVRNGSDPTTRIAAEPNMSQKRRHDPVCGPHPIVVPGPCVANR